MKVPSLWSPPNVPTTFAMLVASGVTPTKIRNELRRQRLARLRHGVYIGTAHLPEDPVQGHLLQALAEQTAVGYLVASHQTAALAHDLAIPDRDLAITGPPTFTAEPTAPVAATYRGITLHRSPLPAHHRVQSPAGLSLTSVARTAVDLAYGLELPQALGVLDSGARAAALELGGSRGSLAAPRIRQFSTQALHDAALSRRYRRGLAAALELVDPRHETYIESVSYGHMVLAELPHPVPQDPIRTVAGTLYPDFHWREFKLLGEADGGIKYEERDSLLREKAREQVLTDMGYRFVRWTGREILTRPAAVVDRIVRALSQAA